MDEILAITAGSSMAAMIFKAPATIRAAFDIDVEDPLEQARLAHARRREQCA